MLKFTIIAGLNDQETKKQEITTDRAYTRILTVLKKNNVEGATFTECKGFYTHEDGTMIFENSIKIELLFITEATAKAICEDLKISLNQESIVLESINLDSDLI